MNNNNKQGLSTIVATLLIILLTLVAVGIIWAVVSGVVESGGESIDLNAKCVQESVTATSVSNSSTTDFSVVLSRDGGNDEIGGIRMIFMNDSSSTFTSDREGTIEPLATVTQNVIISETELLNPSKVTVAVYFLSEAGEKQFCQNPNEKAF